MLSKKGLGGTKKMKEACAKKEVGTKIKKFRR